MLISPAGRRYAALEGSRGQRSTSSSGVEIDEAHLPDDRHVRRARIYAVPGNALAHPAENLWYFCGSTIGCSHTLSLSKHERTWTLSGTGEEGHGSTKEHKHMRFATAEEQCVYEAIRVKRIFDSLFSGSQR